MFSKRTNKLVQKQGCHPSVSALHDCAFEHTGDRSAYIVVGNPPLPGEFWATRLCDGFFVHHRLRVVLEYDDLLTTSLLAEG